MLIRLDYETTRLEGIPEFEGIKLQQGGWVFCHGYIANLGELFLENKPDVNFSCSNAIAAVLEKFSPLETARRIAGTASWLFWEPSLARLWITSDRMGLSPLYFFPAGSAWLFSDSVEAILDAQPSQNSLNKEALTRAALGRYPLPGQTFFKSIQHIQPGRLVMLQAGRWHERVYWQAELQPTLRLRRSEEYEQAYRDLLFKVVDQLVPDVPAGVTLSSGLDSSSLAVAFRANQPHKPFYAVSFIAPELPSADEASQILETCRMLNITPLLVRADQLWTFQTPEVYSLRREAPLLNFFGEVWHGLFQTARENNVQVLLGGSGGDLLFGGRTPHYVDLLVQLRWIEMADQLRRHTQHLNLPRPIRQISKHFILKPLLDAYRPDWLRNTNSPPTYIEPTSIEVATALLNQHRPGGIKRYFRLPGRQYRLEQLISPPETSLAAFRIKTAAAFNIQMRYPFWDHRLTEFALSLPSDQLNNAFTGKWIVRRSLTDRLPESVLGLTDKILPPAIARRGLHERSIANIKHLLSNMRLEELGIINGKLINQAFDDYLNNKTGNNLFFSAVLVEAWLRRWF